MTEEEAKKQVLAALEGLRGHDETDPLVIVPERTILKPYGWIFWVNSKAYIETGDRRSLVIGLWYVIFDSLRSEVFMLNSSDSLERQLTEYEQRYHPQLLLD